MLSTAGEAYQSLVGYAANAGPGENRNGFGKTDQTYTPDSFGRQSPADRGMNVIGFNEPGSFGSQGGSLSRALNLVPTINATAGLHDLVFNANWLDQTAFNNLWTMPASALVAVPAALNNPNTSWITQMKQPPTLTWAIPVQPVTVQSVVRIKTGTPTENKQLVEVLK